MKKLFAIVVLMLMFSCKEKAANIDFAQAIVDKSIAASGGDLYKTKNIDFAFRDRDYILNRENGQRILKRKFKKDSSIITDVTNGVDFQRFEDGVNLIVPDSMAVKYLNAINSVHYFAYLPFGLNDGAVNKEYIGDEKIKGETYHKIKVTFDKEGGGKDYDDEYLYWFNTKTFHPDYLGYLYHVDGGGIRFRAAYNARVVNGIRFVDYENYKPQNEAITVEALSTAYKNNTLELLSKIDLKDIKVY